MDKNLTTILQDLGLSTEEANVYEALLELGQSVVTPVATLAKVQRTTCYNILESLVQKKLATKSNFRGKQAYSAEDPTRLISNLQEEKEAIDLKLQKAKTYEDELTKRFTKNYTKPVIKYVEGLDGIIELYDDSLRCKDKLGIHAYTSLRDLRTELGDYPDKYFADRTRRGIPIRSMAPDTEFAKDAKRLSAEYLREVRLIPKEKFDFSPEIYLYDDKLAVFSFKERFGFLLESKEIVDALKIAWELAWERAAEYDKEIPI